MIQTQNAFEHEVAPFLSGLVKSFLDRKETNSIRSLTTKTKLHRNTLKKIQEGSCNLAHLDHIKIISLVKAIDPNKVEEFSLKYREALNLIAKNSYKGFERVHENLLDMHDAFEGKDELRRPIDYLVFLRAANTGGATFSEIVKDLGNDAIEAISRLTLSKMIKTCEETGKLIATKSKHQHFERESLLEFFPALLDKYKLDNAGKNINYIYYFSQNLNKEGLKKVRDAYADFISICGEVSEDSKYLGDIPYFHIGAMDTLKNEKESEVLQWEN